MKKNKETKCTCKACGNIWYYGKQELRKAKKEKSDNWSSEMHNCSSDLMCCGGCLPAAFLPRHQTKKVKDLKKCPKCNSSAVKKEIIVHKV